MGIFQGGVGLYFYSAVFQGDVALLAVVGAFVVFRLQQLAAQILKAEERIREYVSDHLKREGYHLPASMLSADLKDYPTAIKTISQTGGYRGEGFNPDFVGCVKRLDNDQFRRLFAEWQGPSSTGVHVSQAVRWTVIAVVVSLVALPFSNLVHEHVAWIELPLFSVTIAISIIGLLATQRFILDVLRTPTDLTNVHEKSKNALSSGTTQTGE